MRINNFFDCVLLVDDDPIEGFFNAQLISRSGITSSVKLTSEALEAVEFIRQCCISEEGELNKMLIFLDIHSTAYNGMELLVLVNSMTKKVFEEVNIVILSSSLEKLELDLDKVGVPNSIRFIEKPLTSEKLQELVAKAALA